MQGSQDRRLRPADFESAARSLFDFDRYAEAAADAEVLSGGRAVEHARELEGGVDRRVRSNERWLDDQLTQLVPLERIFV